jgi:hypothetical protein
MKRDPLTAAIHKFNFWPTNIRSQVQTPEPHPEHFPSRKGGASSGASIFPEDVYRNQPED